MLLAGDIGGTKTVLALYDAKGEQLTLIRDATFPSQAHATFEALLKTFLKSSEAPTLRGACFGVAGPVIDGEVQTTNLPWRLEERKLAQALGTPHAKLLNDLEATSYGMLHLTPSELVSLNPGKRRTGNVAVIAAGTGLGEAMLYWDGTEHYPLASEGGHVDFAPRTDREIDLLRYLREKFNGHISYERVLSGPGLANIYSFLRDRGNLPEPDWLAAELKQGDPHAVITQVGLAGKARICTATLELFATLYGAEAGNVALKCVALGGVFVGGGIAPRILPILQNGSFMESFIDKGRFRDLLKDIPVNVSLNPRAPLLGAAHYARHIARH
jgi:glucokinase